MAVASLPPSAFLPFLRRHHYALTNCKTPGLLKEGSAITTDADAEADADLGLVASLRFWHLRQNYDASVTFYTSVAVATVTELSTHHLP